MLRYDVAKLFSVWHCHR